MLSAAASGGYAAFTSPTVALGPSQASSATLRQLPAPGDSFCVPAFSPVQQTPLHTVILRSAAERASTEPIASASNGPPVTVTPPLSLPPSLLGPPKSPQTLPLAIKKERKGKKGERGGGL